MLPIANTLGEILLIHWTTPHISCANKINRSNFIWLNMSKINLHYAGHMKCANKTEKKIHTVSAMVMPPTKYLSYDIEHFTNRGDDLCKCICVDGCILMCK